MKQINSNNNNNNNQNKMKNSIFMVIRYENKLNNAQLKH